MLAYLEELCTALLAHDAIAIHRLLAHPLARSLPRQVREEAIAISRASTNSLRAPIQALRFYHQTLQLGGNDPAPDSTTSESTDADADVPPDPTTDEGSLPSADTTRQILIEAVPRDQIELPFEYEGAAAA